MKNKSAFFTDLDRTLIYSERFLSNDIDTVLVEKKGENAISYMTRDALSLLQQVRKETEFVPVTTRTWEEIVRIKFIKQNLPELMVCNNGACIYKNGVQLEEWDRYIKEKKDNHGQLASIFVETIASLFEDKGLKEIRNHENIYLILKFEEMTWEINQTIEVLNLALRKKGYRIEVNSRKAYLLPNYVAKESAVQFLIDKYKFEKTISSGDSFMDLEMLRTTNRSIAPKHKTFIDDSMQVTNQEGLKAGEEILHLVQYFLRY